MIGKINYSPKKKKKKTFKDKGGQLYGNEKLDLGLGGQYIEEVI